LIYRDGSERKCVNGIGTLDGISAETVPGMVYFIKCLCSVGYIKIGFTTDVQARFSQLQTPMPYQLKLIRLIAGDQAAEKALHERFDDFRYRGEWFRPGQPILDYIEETIDHDVCPPDVHPCAPFRTHKSKAVREWEERVRIQEFENAREITDRIIQRRRLAHLRSIKTGVTT
jgi:hypothetical protein